MAPGDLFCHETHNLLNSSGITWHTDTQRRKLSQFNL